MLAAGFLALAAPTAHAQLIMPVGSVNGAFLYGATVSGTTLYGVGSDPSRTFQTYRLSSPAAPQLLAALPTPPAIGTTQARQVVVTGTTAYVASFDYTNFVPVAKAFLSAYDVSNPAAPVLRKTSQVSSSALTIAASGGYLYVSHDFLSGLTVYDSNLTVVGTYAGVNNVLSLTPNGTSLYVAQSGYLTTVLNLSTPTAPTLSGTVTGSIQAVGGQYGYGLLYPYSANAPDNILLTYDLTTPSAPALLSQTPAPASGTLLTATAQGHAVFTAGDANPHFPVTTQGNSLPVRFYTASTPATPVLVGRDQDTFGGAYALTSGGNYVYAVLGSRLAVYTATSVLATARAAPTAALGPYPNPAHGTLRLPSLAPATPVTISDALGRVCLTTSAPTGSVLDISMLPAGLYQVRAGSMVSRLVVE